MCYRNNAYATITMKRLLVAYKDKLQLIDISLLLHQLSILVLQLIDPFAYMPTDGIWTKESWLHLLILLCAASVLYSPPTLLSDG